jgi:hypothetical protein
MPTNIAFDSTRRYAVLALAASLLLSSLKPALASASSHSANSHSIKINSFIPTARVTMGHETLPPASENESGASASQPGSILDDPLADSAPPLTFSNSNTAMPLQAVANSETFNSNAVDEQFEEAGWSLPILGQMQARGQLKVVHRKVAKTAGQQPPKQLEGCISSADSNSGSALDRLIDTALERDNQAKVLDQAVSHYRTKTQVVIAETKDAADYLIPYRGFGPSSEAGDIILDEKVKLKSRASAEYARQKHIDEVHLKLVSSMMQMAMGLGMADQGRGQDVAQSGFSQLKELVGEDEANKTKDLLLAQAREANIPDSVYQQAVWDVSQKQDKHKTIVETSLDEDPVVHEIKKRVHKYNQKSKFSMAASHVVQTTLGAASLTPTFIGPAAKLALLTYIMSTGGPEQVKLLKELYLDKRFESRCKVVNEEAHLALDNYQLAILTRNPVLLTCAQSVLGQMVPEDTVTDVLGASNMIAHKASPGA